VEQRVQFWQKSKMKTEDLKKEFEKHFDDFEKWNKEFEFEFIDFEKGNFLKIMCRGIVSRLQNWISYVTPFFFPGGTYSSVIQSNIKDEETIRKTKELYKEFMSYYHEGLIAEFSSDEKKQIEYIKKFFKNYSKLKKEVILILEISKDVFDELNFEKKEKGYLG